MALRIRSLRTAGPILVPLNSGRTVRLSPGQDSDELPDTEVAGNAAVDKLRRRGLIDVTAVAAEAAPGRAPSRKRQDAGE